MKPAKNRFLSSDNDDHFPKSLTKIQEFSEIEVANGLRIFLNRHGPKVFSRTRAVPSLFIIGR